MELKDFSEQNQQKIVELTEKIFSFKEPKSGDDFVNSLDLTEEFPDLTNDEINFIVEYLSTFIK